SGDAVYGIVNADVNISDGQTPCISLTGLNAPPNQFFDATGVLRSNWPATNVAKRCTFATSKVVLRVTDNTAINHIRLTSVSPAATPTPTPMPTPTPTPAPTPTPTPAPTPTPTPAPTPTPTPAPTPTPTPTPISTPTPAPGSSDPLVGSTVTLDVDGVVVRSGPSVGAVVVGTEGTAS